MIPAYRLIFAAKIAIPTEIPEINKNVTTKMAMCFYESCLIGTFVFATAGSCALKKNCPNPCAIAWLICCSDTGSTYGIEPSIGAVGCIGCRGNCTVDTSFS